MAGNCWKGLYEGCKWLKLVKNYWKWLEIAENGLETDGNGQKLLEMAWPENVMFNTTVMCRVVQLLYCPEKCQGDK